MMRNSLRWLPALLLALMILTPLTVLAQTQLVVWHAYRGTEKEAFLQVVETFNAAHAKEGLSVKTLAIPYDAYADKITAAVPRGKGPDVFIFAQDRLGGWIESGGVIEPLDFFFDESKADEYIPTTWEAVSYQDNVYGLPLNFKVVTMFYNKALIKTPPKTSTEMVTLAKTLTNQAAGNFGLAYWFSDFYYHSSLMNAFGGSVFAEGHDPVVNIPQNTESMNLLLKWLYEDKILPAEPSTALITNLFNEGRAAMVFSGPWFLAEIKEGLDFGLAPLPTIDEAGGAPMRPWMTVEGAFISQPSEHKDEAYTFVEYLTSVDAGRVMALVGGQTPANKAVYEDDEVANDPVLTAFRKQVEVAVPMPNFAEMTMVWSPVTTAMNTIVRKAATPQAALDAAQEEVIERVKSLRK